jgi:hypothetical protein
MRWGEGGALSAARGGVARGEAVPLPSDLFLTSQLALDLALASLRALRSAKRFFSKETLPDFLQETVDGRSNT